MIGIGLDPSLNGFGVSFELNGKDCSWCVGNTKNLGRSICARHERYTGIVESVCQSLTTAIMESDLCAIICIESYALGMKGASFADLIEMGWQVRMMLSNFSYMYPTVKVVEVAPTSLKKFVTGKGNASKDLIIKEVFKRWSMDFDNDNLADAFGLAQIARCLDNQDLCQNKKQREVVRDLLKANHATLSND